MQTACQKSHPVRVELSALTDKSVSMVATSEGMCDEEKVGHHFEIQKLTYWKLSLGRMDLSH